MAWDQYNSSTNSYDLEIQLTPINVNGSFGTPTIFSPAITAGGATSVTDAETTLPGAAIQNPPAAAVVIPPSRMPWRLRKPTRLPVRRSI